MSVPKKMALLVGCTYSGYPGELYGCHNDVLGMRELLIARFGFKLKHVELLMDRPGSSVMPTGANIKSALNKMVDQAKKGDVLFFHFSGHGTLIKPPYAPKTEEVIVPCDNNLITSEDFRQLVNRVPKGATFTILSDSCNSGGLIDKETEQIGPCATPDDAISKLRPTRMIPFESILQYFTTLTGKMSKDIGTHLVEVFGDDAGIMFRPHDPINKTLEADEGILLSGCQKNEYSCELTEKDVSKPCGAFTYAVQMVFKENPAGRNLSNREVVIKARNIMKLMPDDIENEQHPCLYCSDQNADAPFLGVINDA
ncbi:hypothetical protein DH2020_039157 [Rehmannia glutinosa]|uniref:Peptidase C14 caspase domain-containing protein n=1 Tax=Rehmannia glutinosa TaxID=99300 RepID=A0ABR0UXQ2_REHGL